jgi:surface polysaccharide O-acyltransferase-like enzyme
MMDQLQSSVGFHSLDALRAWAMLLGIVLHSAWFMSTRYFETPITDADGNYFFEYVLYFIHIFRLQAFFLMAGLFAHRESADQHRTFFKLHASFFKLHSWVARPTGTHGPTGRRRSGRSGDPGLIPAGAI